MDRHLAQIVTDEMSLASRELARVSPFDYDEAYAAAFRGFGALRPLQSRTSAAMFQGRALALDLWVDRMNATRKLREQRAADMAVRDAA